MSKVKIPLRWYSDLIRIPGTKDEFILLEWFEEPECINKTLFCLGKYMKVTQYRISMDYVEQYNKYDLTLETTNPNKDSSKFTHLGEYTKENNLYNPCVYEWAREEKWFGDD